MKIHYLQADGFRSLKHIEWKPGDLNVIIGSNASGKSNLLRLLKMISAAAKGRLSEYILRNEGGIESLLWNGQAGFVGFGLDVFSQNKEEPSFASSLSFAPLSNGTGYNITHEAIYTGDKSDADAQQTPMLSRSAESLSFLNGAGVIKAEVPIQREWKNEMALSQVTSLLAGADDFLSYKRYLENWAIYEQINTASDAPLRRAVIAGNETVLAPDAQNLTNVLNTLYMNDRDFRQEIDLGMRAAFDDYDYLVFHSPTSQRVELGVQWKSLNRPTYTADLSDGTLRFLFLLTVLANLELPSLIAIDEPEIGLHPRMMSIVAEFAVDAARRSQVIFTTHSAAFLDAFRDKRPTTTVAGTENGETTLKVVDDEELAYWIKDFTLGDIFRSGTLEHIA